MNLNGAYGDIGLIGYCDSSSLLVQNSNMNGLVNATQMSAGYRGGMLVAYCSASNATLSNTVSQQNISCQNHLCGFFGGLYGSSLAINGLNATGFY